MADYVSDQKVFAFLKEKGVHFEAAHQVRVFAGGRTRQFATAEAGPVNAEGDSVLHIAARENYMEEVKRLNRANANFEAENGAGNTPLMIAAVRGHFELVEYLVKHGVHINRVHKSGSTAVSLAVWKNHTPISLFLIGRGADINNCDEFGDIPLIDASKHGEAKVTYALIQRRSPLNHRNKKGQTALMLAAGGGHEDCVLLLRSAGADASLKDAGGRTAADYAELPKIKVALTKTGLKPLPMLRAPLPVNDPSVSGDPSIVAAARTGDLKKLTELLDAKADLEIRNPVRIDRINSEPLTLQICFSLWLSLCACLPLR